MDPSVVGVGHPGQVAREGAGDLDVQSGGPVLAGVQLRVFGPGPALKQGAIDDQLHGGIQVLHSRHTDFQSPDDQGRVGADDAGDGGLGDAVELGEQLLGQVVPQPGSGSGARTGTAPAPSPRTPADQGFSAKMASRRPATSHRGILVLLFVMAVCFLVGLA